MFQYNLIAFEARSSEPLLKTYSSEYLCKLFFIEDDIFFRKRILSILTVRMDTMDNVRHFLDLIHPEESAMINYKSINDANIFKDKSL